MGDITAHFSAYEFKCSCGCGGNGTSKALVEKFEKIYEYLAGTERGVKSVNITSGYRCPKHSVAVGGSADDAHTRGIAADFYALDKSGTRWASRELAAVCEKLGFSGIGVIDNTAVHADIRTTANYKNGHWFGNEMTGNDNIQTWAEFLPKQVSTKPTAETKAVTLVIDGVTYKGTLTKA